MFAYALRAVVLLGVLGWYSTGIWKMIDSYFKDRFDKYLREECTKNPRIKTDIDAYRAKHDRIDKTIDTFPSVTKNDDSKETDDHNNGNKYKSSVTVDLLHFIEFNNENEKQKLPESISKKPIELPSLNNLLKKKKKNKIKTITSTHQDFGVDKMKASADCDFSEFEYEEDKEKAHGKVPGSISVTDLPFKPKADLGHLGIITEDEYCPYKSNYHEENCKDTTKWP